MLGMPEVQTPGVCTLAQALECGPGCVAGQFVLARACGEPALVRHRECGAWGDLCAVREPPSLALSSVTRLAVARRGRAAAEPTVGGPQLLGRTR